jgi:hypothetical protein
MEPQASTLSVEGSGYGISGSFGKSTSWPAPGVVQTPGEPERATRAGGIGGSGPSTPLNGPNQVADFGKYSSKIASPSASVRAERLPPSTSPQSSTGLLEADPALTPLYCSRGVSSPKTS